MTRQSSSVFDALFFHQFALVLSGIAGLGYQLVWVRQFAVGLGHEIPSMLAVVAGFFVGLALGAWLLDRIIGRSRFPARWYVGLELVIGVWALLSIPLIQWLVSHAPVWIGISPSPVQHWLLAFLLPTLALLPATVAMGATLPAMERLASLAKQKARLVGGLYAANTAGAVIGTLGSTYWLMPLIGHIGTVKVLALINIAVAALVAIAHWNSRVVESSNVEKGDIDKKTQSQKIIVREKHQALSSGYLLVLLLTTGLLGIGYEVLAVRIMSQIVEGTVYSLAALLSVYLIGTTIGAAIYQRFLTQLNFEKLLTRLLVAISLSGLIGILALYNSPELYKTLRTLLGDSMWAVLTSEAAVAVSVLALPSIAMGATLSHLLQASRGVYGGLGNALALNTLGAALAPSLIGVLLLTTVGAKWALASLVIGYLLLLPKTPTRLWLIPSVTALTILLLPTKSHVLKLRDGESVLAFKEGVLASVAVVERNGARNLRVNNRFQMGGTSATAMLVQRPQTHIPLLLHPDPTDVLFLGVATGISTGQAILHADLNIDAVELVPESLELLHWFDKANRSLESNTNAQLYSADARRFVRSTEKQYDVVIADLFQPGRDGAGLLYTQEHFEAVRTRLRAGGLFAQWLPFYQLDEESIRIIVATFQRVFPYSVAFLAYNDIQYPAVALVGSMQPFNYPNNYYEQRVSNAPALQQELDQLLFNSDIRLFGQQLLDQQQLEALAADAPINSDDLPRLLYQAPRFTYRRDAVSYGRLMPIIEIFGLPEAQLMPAQNERIDRYIEARNIYLNGLAVHLTEGAEAAIIHYKKATLASNDFTSSYAQLVSIALEKINNRSRAEGKAILQWLHEQRSEIPAAGHLLKRLNGN